MTEKVNDDSKLITNFIRIKRKSIDEKKVAFQRVKRQVPQIVVIQSQATQESTKIAKKKRSKKWLFKLDEVDSGTQNI